MSIRKRHGIVAVAFVVAGWLPVITTQAAAAERSLVRAVPNDVFLCVWSTKTPERAFVDEYWGAVTDALVESGIGTDVLKMITGKMDEADRAEFDRLKDLALERFGAVDWKALGAGENVFAERFRPLEEQHPTYVGPPEMLFLFSQKPGKAEHNYEGLAEILNTLADEVNQAAEEQVLVVEQSQAHGAPITTLSIPNLPPEAPQIWVGIARHDDVVMFAFGQELFNESLGMLAGEGAANSILNDQRYQDAFAKLPPAKDSKTFFDLQAMLRPYRKLAKDLPPMIAHNPHATEEEAQKADAWAGGMTAVAERLLDAVGIIDYTATVEYTEGYTLHAETVVALVPDARERPIYPAIASRGSMKDSLRFLPQETAAFSLSQGGDLDALHGFLRDTAKAFGPDGEQLLAKWDAFQEESGFDLERDVLSWYDGDSISVTLADGEWVWLVKVSDEQLAREKMGQAVTFCTQQVRQLASENPALNMLTAVAMPLDDERLPEFESLRFMLTPQPFVWGVAKDHLIVGSSAEAVVLCLETAAGQHPSVRQNKQVMAEALLPGKPFCSASLKDLRSAGDDAAEVIGMMTMASGMAGTFIPEPEVQAVLMRVSTLLSKLAPVVRKIDFYKSSASYTTFDGRAWYSHGVTHYVDPAERKPAPPTAAAN